MIVSPAFRGKRYAVLGLARSGLATVRALVASGAHVVAWDSKEDARAAVGDGVVLSDPLEIDLAGFDGVVVSPGVPINRHPIADKAHAANVPLIGDIELFSQARPSLPPHKVIGITGTNGKSTTTALIHHIVETAGIPARLGGNIGLPILGQEPLPEGGVYVLELSSYQIDLCHALDCDIAVLLNITPDHLDRYDGFTDYAAAKERLFTMQHVDKVAVIATEDDRTKMIASRINHRLMRVSSKQVGDQSRWPSLQGPHNAQNVAAARAVAEVLGIKASTIEEALHTYPGLPHRMERVRELGGVLYVNDSKATNPTSTAPALAAYPAIHWILGGRAKTEDLDACEPHFSHVRAAYTIGESAGMFASLLKGSMPVSECGSLDVAVLAASKAAVAGETVLLSPACASFDQFTDFEARGDAFRAAVEALA
ncbi:UDP-N-acetylmuramoyl-L-alanine--D-glutamate ligase [Aquisediminimonas profunda]|uniref:UDP-N-acetylmuramoyl-L-alanine--D-glutamate ligase n=1 Tax=Aquisediminimonas profunda TaxID=1550733 RepID=UPI001C625E85|nr:UDP-N-acetylmuramoyl-L-alanine--D-glutamate ligase [Aquisediminimonas profunda]